MTPQEKQNARAVRLAATEARRAARQALMAARKAAQEEKIKEREPVRDARAERDYQKCIKGLPAVRQQMRDNCIANPGGQQCKDLLQGRYPRCAPVSYLRGKPPTAEEISCGATYSDCLENMLPKMISQQAARCASDPTGQDCKDIAAKRYPTCLECGE